MYVRQLVGVAIVDQNEFEIEARFSEPISGLAPAALSLFWKGLGGAGMSPLQREKADMFKAQVSGITTSSQIRAEKGIQDDIIRITLNLSPNTAYDRAGNSGPLHRESIEVMVDLADERQADLVLSANQLGLGRPAFGSPTDVILLICTSSLLICVCASGFFLYRRTRKRRHRQYNHVVADDCEEDFERYALQAFEQYSQGKTNDFGQVKRLLLRSASIAQIVDLCFLKIVMALCYSQAFDLHRDRNISWCHLLILPHNRTG